MKTIKTISLPKQTATKISLVVMSDSHGNDDSVNYVISQNPDADMFIHCGDVQTDHHLFKMLTAVKGNHDYEKYNKDLPEEIILEIFNHRILVFHSHTLDYDYDTYLQKIADYGKRKKCDIVIFGHLHIITDTAVDSVRLLSPGSLFFNFPLTDMGYHVIDFYQDGNYEVRFIPLDEKFQLKADN